MNDTYESDEKFEEVFFPILSFVSLLIIFFLKISN
jgi:hypothetical protein